MPAKKLQMNIARSLQVRLALGYGLIIGALLILLNTYPLLMSQNMMFRSQQSSLQNQAMLIINSLSTADELTTETVEQAISHVEDIEAKRVLVTNEAGLVLYDTGKPSSVGKYALVGELVSALRGNDAATSTYKDGTFFTRSATPIMTRNTVAGAVCLYEEDMEQGDLLEEIQHNLRLISVVVCLAVLGLFAAFSTGLTRRINMLLTGIRTVRAGEYSHRVSMSGHDELAQLAEELNQLTGRLESTEEERRRFVSDASHELKTPLASIRLLTDSILQDENIDRETTREFVADIGESADRLIHISQELLALNRLDEERDIQRSAVDVSQQAERTCRMLTPLASQAQVTLETRLERDCLVWSSSDDIHQICRNLIENAIKYNRAGGRVLVITSREKDTLILSVVDTGMGIPKEDMSRIFERFYRVDKARSRAAGGTGLGLSIVRDTVQLHGGSITVSDRTNGPGTCFTVTLPAWREEGPS